LTIYFRDQLYIGVDLLHLHISQGLVDHLQAGLGIADESLNLFLRAQQRQQLLLVLVTLIPGQHLFGQLVPLDLLPTYSRLNLIAHQFELALDNIDLLNMVGLCVELLLGLGLVMVLIVAEAHTHGLK